jgi:polyferredoxin
MLENVYRLQIMNATEREQQYRLKVEGLEGLRIASEESVNVGSAQSRWVAVRLQLPYGKLAPGSQRIHFEIEAVGTGDQVREKSVFLVPR